MSNQFKEKQKQEALQRMEVLIEKFSLNPNLHKYLSEDRLYYSYFVVAGVMASIDTISYEEENERICRDFEEKHGAYVYHAIESETIYGKMLAMLYVSKNEQEWEFERLGDNYITSYVYNFTDEEGAFGDIFLASVDGALVRTDIF
ncbi:MAG: hypothetical protein E7411_00050 [Ruminococcaceae bacterium]|nr:hypothetical protein [Oscillospiraceae bacterium]